ncbi:rho-related GTP-binding protein Rho6-like [Sycon ciliatum]|uniref:rho-related GTP-binding protein Rho6-like n=1 Tax=Sycon ciliatum TaxID=27933 RepID=UPI0031F5FCA4
MQRGPIEQLKVAVIGDGTVGKTSLLYTFSSNVFPGEYLPTYDTDHFAAIVTFNGEHYRLLLWDSPGQDELFAPVRPLLFQQVDVILVCFAIDSPASLHNARYRWVPELKKVTPDTPMIIVGTKSDLRPARRYPQAINGHSSSSSTSHTTHAPIRLSSWSHQMASGDKSPHGSLAPRSSRSPFPLLSPRKHSSRDRDHAPSTSSATSPTSATPTHHGSHRLTPNGRHNHTNGTSPDNNHDLTSPEQGGPTSPAKTASGKPIIEYTEGLQLAREAGASAYVECSALVKSGMDGVFQETCAAYCLKHDRLYKSSPAVRSSMRWRSRPTTGYKPSFRRAL